MCNMIQSGELLEALPYAGIKTGIQELRKRAQELTTDRTRYFLINE